MFGTILITFIITSLGMTVLFMFEQFQQKERETQQLRKANDNLNQQVSDYRAIEHENREKNAYKKGLYDGRETDALYRKMVSKISKGEQATVMMYGKND